MTATRQGMGLIELIVALLLLSIGVLGLVGTAIVAQTSFTRAAGVELAARTAGALLDSLLQEPAPASGASNRPGLAISWTVTRADGLVHVHATIEAAVGDSVPHRSSWHAARAE